MMLIYLVPLFLASVALQVKSRRMERAAIVLAGVILLTREGVGYDYYNYVFIFERDIPFYLSPLSDLLQDFARVMAVPNGFMGIAAILSTLLLLWLSRASVDPRLSTVMFLAFPFFFLESFTIVRQMLALLVAAASYQFLRRNLYISSGVAYALAMGVHVSAAISLPFFVMTNPHLSWKNLVILSGGGVLVIIIGVVFLDSGRFTRYSQTEMFGNYYLIVGAAALVIALLSDSRELSVCAVFGLVAAIAVEQLGNYVLNRAIMFFYIPFLFLNIQAVSMNVSIRPLLSYAIVIALFFAAFSVKVAEPVNGFASFQTVFETTP